MMRGRQERLARLRSVRRRFQINPRRFEQLVSEALSQLPDELKERIQNVAVVVQDSPSPGHLEQDPHESEEVLLGLYEGTPLTDRDSAYHLATPDRITIFRRPILAICSDAREVVQEVRQTVIHELGHHFGLDDDELD